jgi:DNA-binding transcriptional regulator GbsR (MarR family)
MIMEAWQRIFVEQVGLLADTGLPRSITRVLGWLVVCEPPEQSAEQLRATLQLSAGAVSAAASSLVRAGIVTRVTFPGDRRLYYRLQPDGWQRLLRSRLEATSEVRRLAEEALDASGGQTSERLRAMRDFYARCEVVFADLLEQPKQASQAKQAKRR